MLDLGSIAIAPTAIETQRYGIPWYWTSEFSCSRERLQQGLLKLRPQELSPFIGVAAFWKRALRRPSLTFRCGFAIVVLSAWNTSSILPFHPGCLLLSRWASYIHVSKSTFSCERPGQPFEVNVSRADYTSSDLVLSSVSISRPSWQWCCRSTGPSVDSVNLSTCAISSWNSL